jgi:hypothetical protein
MSRFPLRCVPPAPHFSRLLFAIASCSGSAPLFVCEKPGVRGCRIRLQPPILAWIIGPIRPQPGQAPGSGGVAVRYKFGLLLFLFLAALGCGGDNALNSPTALKMKGLANAYLDHVVGRGGSPANEESLKKHMRELRASVQYDYQIDPNNVDASFVSSRDNQPLVVIYGKGVGKISGDSKHVIAHEKTGKNGKRLVVFVSTKVDVVDEAELERLKSAKD